MGIGFWQLAVGLWLFQAESQVPTAKCLNFEFTVQRKRGSNEGRVQGCCQRTFVRSKLPVVSAVVVPALRKVREGRGTRTCGGFWRVARIPKWGCPISRVFCEKWGGCLGLIKEIPQI
jgi:hypothetical protein